MPADQRATIVRIITRLNVGGPAHQAVALTARLQDERFRSVLITGRVGSGEAEFSRLSRAYGVTSTVVPQLQRELHPLRDLIAFVKLARCLWRERPAIIHTHMAKAGALGRLAGVLYRACHPGRRVILVHTYHGHVLHGYFGSLANRVFLAIERWLARRTQRLIAVSEAIQEELLAYGIGTRGQFVVVPVGLPIEPLLLVGPAARENGTPFSIGMVGRLTAVKDPERFLDAVERLRRTAQQLRIRAAIVGDGELRSELQQSVHNRGLDDVVQFHGWRFDLPQVYEALDCLCLTSRNEGTPLAVIEAMAAGRTVIATDVGGMRDLLGAAVAEQPDPDFEMLERGVLVPTGRPQDFAKALGFLAQQPQWRSRLGAAARAHVQSRYTTDRLVRDIRALYGALLQPPTSQGSHASAIHRAA